MNIYILKYHSEQKKFCKVINSKQLQSYNCSPKKKTDQTNLFVQVWLSFKSVIVRVSSTRRRHQYRYNDTIRINKWELNGGCPKQTRHDSIR